MKYNTRSGNSVSHIQEFEESFYCIGVKSINGKLFPVMFKGEELR